MKKLLILFFCLSTLSVLAQDDAVVTSVLRVEKNGVSGPTEKILNPYRKIVVTTLNGKKHTFTEYKLLGDSAIASDYEVVAIRDIMSIKGHVTGETGRKVAGGVLMVGGLGAGAVLLAGGVVSLMTGTFVPATLLVVPALGVAYLGTRVAGARRFDTRNDWILTIVPVPNQ